MWSEKRTIRYIIGDPPAEELKREVLELRQRCDELEKRHLRTSILFWIAFVCNLVNFAIWFTQ